MYAQRVETGPWFGVGKTLSGEQAYIKLQNIGSANDNRKQCLYVHIPFCETICSFCALYTKAVKSTQKHIFDEYLSYVLRSLDNHPCVRPSQPPTTVHIGGGSPLHIGLERFTLLTNGLRKAFGDSEKTEWALETTTSSINEETLRILQQLNYQRIHLGIQTLDDSIRVGLGRRETGKQCVAKIEQLHKYEFLTSVDLIIGFDGMTEDVLMRDLSTLYDAGIRMFSICELRFRSLRDRNRLHTPQRLTHNRRLWQCIWNFMEEHGLVPIHLGQFGRDDNDNLYFTHPARGEDCVAIGPYAHGSSGLLYYSNKLLPEYYTAVEEQVSPIAHAVLYDDSIQAIRQLESQLLSHTVTEDVLAQVERFYGTAFLDIFQNWLHHSLLNKAEENAFRLSVDGSWFVGNMIEHLRHLPFQKDKRMVSA